jgi:hypothetical protein
MMPGRRSQVRLLVRVVIYILVIIALWLLRGRPGLRRFTGRFAGGGAADTTLVVMGAEPAFVALS